MRKWELCQSFQLYNRSKIHKCAFFYYILWFFYGNLEFNGYNIQSIIVTLLSWYHCPIMPIIPPEHCAFSIRTYNYFTNLKVQHCPNSQIKLPVQHISSKATIPQQQYTANSDQNNHQDNSCPPIKQPGQNMYHKYMYLQYMYPKYMYRVFSIHVSQI